MNEQEMQFADPDWKPEGQTVQQMQEHEEPTLSYTPRPVRVNQTRRQNRRPVGSTIYEQGYRGRSSWEPETTTTPPSVVRQTHVQNILPPSMIRQAPAQHQYTYPWGVMNNRFPWWAVVLIIVILIILLRFLSLLS